MSNFNPKCVHGNKDLGYSVTGHITPCCWVNTAQYDSLLCNFFKDEMHIDNFNSVEEILDTEIWISFFNLLINTPEQAPERCKKFCSVNLDTNTEGKTISIPIK